MNAHDLAEDLEFVAANFISIIADVHLMDVAEFIRKQESQIETQGKVNKELMERIIELEKQIYGSR